jgi:hypothetical protein
MHVRRQSQWSTQDPSSSQQPNVRICSPRELRCVARRAPAGQPFHAIRLGNSIQGVGHGAYWFPAGEGLVAVQDGLLISVNVLNGIASQPDRSFALAVELLCNRGLICNDVSDRRHQEFAKALAGAFVSNRKDTT